VLGNRRPEIRDTGAELTLLGGWALRFDGRLLKVPLRERRVLACLVIESQRQDRYRLAEFLWPDASEERAAANLRTALSNLRHIAPGIVCGGRDCVQLSAGLQCDVIRLRAAIRTAMAQQVAPAGDNTLLEALSVGELLPGWYDEWILLERERLNNQRLRALQHLGRLALRCRDPRLAVSCALEAAEIEPHDEDTAHILISAQLALGHLADAARSYEHYRIGLVDELGLEPSPRLSTLLPVGLAD
jgi:DNA-binding SARP family transcriptional activator